MKRISCWMLAAALVLSLCACKGKEDSGGQVASFYYLRSDLTYGSETDVVVPESREIGAQADPAGLLDLYLTGPENPELTSPFPAGTRLEMVQQRGASLYVTMSSEFGQLTGIDLSIACACLAKTCLEFSGVESVRIAAEDTLLDGRAWIHLEPSDFIFQDSSAGKIRSGAIPNPIDGQ